MNLKRKMRKGFTLVELVVVIAVIAVLAAVSVGAYFGVTDSANSSNATAAYKQIKDLWVMYSVDEYNSNWSAERNAKEFCLKYVEEYGPDYYVNYAKVSIDTTETEASNAHGRNDANSEAILFKIETNYPTWFIVSDDLIVEEGTPSKTEEDFKTSLTNSTRLSDDSISKVTSEDFAFDIETIKIDPVTGRKVRGFKFYNITINENSEVKDKFYIRPGETIYSESRSQYAPGEVNTQVNGGNTFIGYKFALFDGNTEVYSTDEIRLEEDLDNATKIDTTHPEYVYGYEVATKSYEYKDYSNNIDTSAYPFILAKAEFAINSQQETWDRTSRELELKPNKVSLFYIQNDYYLSSDDFEELSSKSNNDTIFLFVNSLNATITKDITINPNVALVVGDYSSEGITSLVSASSIKKVKQTREKISGGWNPTYTPWKDVDNGTISLFKDNFYDIKSNVDLNNYVVANSEAIPNPFDRTKFLDESTYLKAKLTITKSGTLNMSEGSYLLVDGKLHMPSAGTVLQVSNRGEIVNNGTINLGNSLSNTGAKLRTLSRITGTGWIKTHGNSEIFDIMKFNDFFGGTHATEMIEQKIFPYNDYVLDNIRCNVEVNYGSKYIVKSGMYMSNYNFITNEFVFLSKDNDNSFFNIQEGGQVLLCPGDNENTKVIISKGILDDNYVNVKFNVETEDGDILGGLLGGFIGALSNISIDTRKTNLPISNIDFIIKKDAKLILDLQREKGAYELLPSSSFEIEKDGELSIANAKLAVLTPKDFVEINSYITNDLDDIYSDRCKILYQDFANMDGNHINVVIDGVININQGSIYINEDGINELDESNIINVYNNISLNSNIDTSNMVINTYNYSYLIGDHVTAKDNGIAKTIVLNSYNPNSYAKQ